MAKIPDQPSDLFEPITRDYRAVFGSDLVSLMLYGSAAGDGYVKGKSDINLLVVLTQKGIERFEDCVSLVKAWRKRNVAVPLVVTRAFITSSLDVFPIEFLNMKHSTILIDGEDVLSQLSFDRSALRLQIERELKSKKLWLQEGYLDVEGSPRRLRELIARSVSSLVAIFNALLFLQTGDVPPNKHQTILKMGGVFGLDTRVFDLVFLIRQDSDSLTGEEVAALFKQYLTELQKVAVSVDRLSSTQRGDT